MNRIALLSVGAAALSLLCRPLPAAAPAAASVRTFHIGNSLTDTVDGWLRPLAASAGDSLDFHRFTIPGAPTDWLWDHPGTGFGDSDYARAFAELAPIDHIFTQPFAGHGRSVSNEADYSGRFFRLCSRYSPHVQPWLYVQWPAPDFADSWARGEGAAQELGLKPASTWQEGVANHTAYTEAVARLVDRAFAVRPVRIVPGGSALAALKTEVDAGRVPGLSDFFGEIFADDIHLTAKGRYLISLVHYAVIYGESPEGKVSVLESGLTPEQAALFQRLAWQAVRGYPWAGISEPPRGPVTTEERRRIEEALPATAPAPPAKARRLLIFDRNVGYGGHPSAAHANLAFTLMGQRTGAFEAVVLYDPSAFAADNLEQFDAVFFDNTVGNLFEDPQLRQNLLAFVSSGGGLMGVHGTSVAFTRWPGAQEDWPEFGEMLGARGAAHRDSDERVFIKVEDPDHPLVRAFGGTGFEYRDEFFRFHEPYSREKLRILLSIDTERTGLGQGQARGDCERADNDYALAWIRSHGHGRVFYCTIAHNPYVFWDRRMLEFYLAATQFVLGDLPADTTPSARLRTGE